ncbi:lipase family protein [Brevibacterium paucivorans]|uniref:lipase family protein n=1 Tax=Brevibacterium paucivorans TaxID=170994 RepID=UPI003218F50D
MSGGARGVSAHLDDMEKTADELERLARELAHVGTRSLVSQRDPELGVSVIASAPTWFEVRKSMSEFTVFVGASATRLEATAVALRASVMAYRQAQRASERIIDDALTAVGNIAGHAVRGALVLLPSFVISAYLPILAVDLQVNFVRRFLGVEGPDFVLTRALAKNARDIAQRGIDNLTQKAFTHPGVSRRVIEHVIPGFVGGFAGFPPNIQNLFRTPHSSEQVTTMMVNTGYTVGVFDSSVTVTKVEQSLARQVHPTDLSELYARQRSVHSGRDNGRVRVDKVRGADGVERVVVYVPATTDWSVGSGNGTDMQTNLETIAGKDSAMRKVVRQALEDAGVDGSTEIMLVGYSQGGIVAMSLADDAEFASKYNVTTVVTVGSPVSDYRVPDSVEVLSIEHDHDLVPQLDGRKNPDQHNWTTVTTSPHLGTGQQAQDAHSGDVYAEAIAGIENAPEVQAFKRKRGEFFAGTVTESHQYEGTRP